MKTKLLLLLIAFLSLNGNAHDTLVDNWKNNSFNKSTEIVSIPDVSFKSALVADTAINTNGDSDIQVSEAEAFTGNLVAKELEIADLTGLEAFINITGLDVRKNNNISSVDLSKNTALEEVYINNNNLTSIDLSANTKLTKLWINGNQLTSIDVSNNPLFETLGIMDNPITTVDISNLTNISTFYMYRTQITSIDLSSNTNLTKFRAYENSLTNLDVSKNTLLKEISVQNNSLESVNLKNGNNSLITVFDVTGNTNLTCVQVDDATYSTANWTNIDNASVFSTDCYAPVVTITDIKFKTALVADTAINTNGDSDIQVSEAEAFTGNLVAKELEIADLTGLEAFINITGLDVRKNNNISSVDLSKNTALEEVYINNNILTSIDLSANTKLTKLWINQNQLTSIDVSNNPLFETLGIMDNPITTIDVSNLTNLSTFYMYRTQITSIDLGANTNLTKFRTYENSLTNLDLSKNTLLVELSAQNNSLERVNLKNGNNSIITDFNVIGNTNLTCLEVDDVSYATTNWTNIDNASVFNTDCSSVWEVYTEDTTFDSALISITGLDGDGDGKITYEEAQAFTGDLDLSGQNITDVTGLEAFTNAASIDISGNNITDISKLLGNSPVFIISKTSGVKKSVERKNNQGIKKINVANNLIQEIDISLVSSITELIMNNNKLKYLNLNNGANSTLVKLDATGNPNLICIQVDDVAIAVANINWKKDVTASYNTFCEKPALSSEAYLITNVALYPNPADTFITIEFSDNLELSKVEIYSLLGKKIIVSNSKTIEIQNLPSGVYFTRIFTDKGMITKKVIKK